MSEWLVLPLLSVSLILALGLDRWLGDPASWHPIVGFGRMIAWGERRLNKGQGRFVKGVVFHSALLLVVGGLGIGLSWLLPLWIGGVWAVVCFVLVHVLGIFYMLSGTTLAREVRAVFDALEGGLEEGRRQVSRIVGRDTQSLKTEEVQTAALETLSENLSDGVIAPLFWLGLLGLPGMLLYKMTNTQDSMVGYKNHRYKDYGCFSARLDDVLNYIPARLTAFLMLLVAHRLDLVSFVREQGSRHSSPNSGYPEAALAGILDCRFGGAHDYFGQRVEKPYIGTTKRQLNYQDLELALRINRRSELLMVGLLLLSWFILFLYIFSR